MKNTSLTVKIWLAISIVSLVLYVIILITTPFVIRNIFSDNLMEPQGPPRGGLREPLPPVVDLGGFRIRGFILLDDGTTIPPMARETLADSLYQEINSKAISQQVHRVLHESSDGNVSYVIRKDMAYGHPLYQVSFFRQSEEDVFVSTLLLRLMTYAGIALVVSWFASLFLVRYLTRPLIQMEQHVKRIASRNWHDPLNIQQGDEIGKLAGSIESMRRQLVKQDEAQQAMLQNISHELKTPTMVIRSYAQAINDGVYPKGDLAGSIKVIDEEGERLEKLVKQLNYLARLEYLAAKQPAQEKIKLHQLIDLVTQRLSPQRPEITWQINLQPITVSGDEDTLRVMVENLLDNHLRYAVSCLEIGLKLNHGATEVTLYLWNDGSNIEPHILSDLIRPFRKGRGGKFGLGLTIVQRIVKMYQGQVEVYPVLWTQEKV